MPADRVDPADLADPVAHLQVEGPAAAVADSALAA
jgi:hypothetical protein